MHSLLVWFGRELDISRVFVVRELSLCPMCHYATLGINERFFGRAHQGFASHPFGVPLTEYYSGVIGCRNG